MKVNIIGAGISGLAAGCYLQMNGFDTEIFEKNPKSGGLCTSWTKNGFTFDGCIHWLLGSNSGNAFYKLWSELIDMESVEFISHEIKVEIELKNSCDKNGDKIFRLYTNLDRLEKYMLGLAPEDARHIRRLIRSMRIMQQYEIPPMIDSIPKLVPLKRKAGMIKYLPLLFEFLKWKNVTNYSFADRLSNPFLKEAFQLMYDGDEVKILIMTMPLAFYDKKAAGYPIGGSYKFIRRIEQRYLKLGGKIRYDSDVDKILTEDNAAWGVRLKDGTESYSDITISAADWYYTVFHALGGRYTSKRLTALKNLETLEVYPSIFMVSLGVSGEFGDLPHFIRYPLVETLHSPDGTDYDRFEVHIYNYDPTLAPAGKTIITVSFYTRKGDFWVDLHKTDKLEYDRLKKEFAGQIIDVLDRKLKGIKSKVDVVDVATPATYHSYTNNWKGSVQGWFPGDNLAARSPVRIELPGLKNFYYSSHWSIPGGGTPVCLKSARDLVQAICHRQKREFKVYPPEKER